MAANRYIAAALGCWEMAPLQATPIDGAVAVVGMCRYPLTGSGWGSKAVIQAHGYPAPAVRTAP